MKFDWTAETTPASGLSRGAALIGRAAYAKLDSTVFFPGKRNCLVLPGPRLDTAPLMAGDLRSEFARSSQNCRT